MTNPKNGSTLASWQLISLGAGSVVILGLAGFGAWNLLVPRNNASQSTVTSEAQDAIQKKLIGQWQAKVSNGSSQQTGLLIFSDSNKFYAITSGQALAGSYQVMDTSAKPQTIIFTLQVAKGTTVSQTLELVDDRRLVSVTDSTSFEKTSDTGVLPEGVKLAELTPPGAKAKQSEARNNIGAVNRAYQAYYLEKGEFSASSFTDLGVGIPTETENYKYTIDVVDRKQVARVIATSKQEGLKSYLGIIYLVKISNQIATQAIACESLQPTTAIPPRPSTGGRDTGTQTCPDGYRNLGG